MKTEKTIAAHESLVKAMEDYVISNIHRHITTEELSEHFEVSVTHIKNCFADAKGEAVQTYIRRKKMETAANLLIEGKRTVLDIAASVGYANGSKFAGAFRKVMGVSPRVYRVKMLEQSIR